MKNMFGGYYLPSDEEFKELWEKCIFVLDANVLLNLYRYPKDARDDLINIFNKISDRLWIPHQVALEYQDNRLLVISEQSRKFDEVKSLLNETLEKLKSNLEPLSLKKRHSAIKADDFLKGVNKQFEKYLSELEALEKEHPDVFDPDKLRGEIDKLYEERIGSPPQNQEELDKIYSEGEKRYEINLPPGYMDKEKVKGKERHLFNQLEFKCAYGDLILWYQLIDQAKSKEDFKYIIFITDDDKEDWWWIVDSQGKKTIGPRPELVEEIKSKANVRLFYMYNTERFLKYAQHHLKAEVKPDSISEVRDIHREKIIEKSRTDLTVLENRLNEMEKRKIELSKIKKVQQRNLSALTHHLDALKNFMSLDEKANESMLISQMEVRAKILEIEKMISDIDNKLNQVEYDKIAVFERVKTIQKELNSGILE
jgi:hypothetical protein